jgi:hypothetical protein
MAGGINLTGLPDPGDYNLGRGIVYFAPIHPTTGKAMEFRDLGNAPEFNMTVTTETLKHQSSRAGLKVTDKEVVTSLEASLKLTLDEINFDNLALFMSGTASTVAAAGNPALAGTGGTFALGGLTTIAFPVKKGYWYDLVKKTTGERIFDIAKANLSVRSNESEDEVTPTVLNEGTDYTVDEKMGRIFIPSTSTIVPGTTPVIYFTLAADAGALGYDQVSGLTQTTIRGVLKFIGANPANGDKKIEHVFYAISLKADGDFSLISDDWTKMGFTGTAEKNEIGYPLTPTYSARTHANA